MSIRAREDKMIITEKEFNATTGKETITERDETVAEKLARETHESEILAMQKIDATRATEKAALLTKLGITESEAALLLS